MQRRRIVVAEDIELYETVVHRVEVEMRGDRILVDLVRRILDRRVVVYLGILVVIARHDDDAARVLTGRDLDALAALFKPLHLGG